jgi:hypothetical protein
MKPRPATGWCLKGPDGRLYLGTVYATQKGVLFLAECVPEAWRVDRGSVVVLEVGWKVVRVKLVEVRR